MRFLLTCLALVVSATVFGQNIQVRGNVTSADDGLSVIGASVQVVGTKIGAVTDINGDFFLDNVPAKSVLRVSYVGMKTLEVEAQPVVKVILASDAEALDAVVFTGYGAQRREAFTGAAAKVSSDALERKLDANFMKALEGTVTGVQMANSTGQPGVWGSVLVRGRGSISSGTQPLYVIDGMPVNSDTDAMSSSSNNPMDPMAGINPNDIENVTVLKDAAATAIYGARAANGVIIITTKKGNKGKANINLDIKKGISTVANNNMKFANAAETAELFANGLVAYGAYPNYDAAYAYIVKRYTPYGWDGQSSYDWLDAVTRNGAYQDYNLSVNGQSGSTNYYVSMGYMDNEGIVIGSDFDRYSGRVNLNSKFKVFTLGLNASYSTSKKHGFSQSTGGSMTSAIVGAETQTLPFYPFKIDEEYNQNFTYNPLAVWDEELGDIAEQKTTTVNLNPSLQVDFGKGVYFKTTLGVNVYGLREYQYWSAIYNNQGKNYNGLGQQYNSETKTITWNNVLGWNYMIDNRHNFNVLVGQEMQKKTYWYEYYEGEDFPFASAGMRELTTVGSWGDSEYYQSEATLASYFIDAHYALDNKYNFSASFRRDGSSVFGADRRWGNFWSVGAKWNFTNEDFLRNEILTNGALKVSYGTVGNQDIGWYAARGFYVSGSNYHSMPGMTPTSISNRQLTWEVSNKFDVGVELTFWDRLNLNVDFYNEITSDALFSVPLSLTTGMSSMYQNIGKIRNRGVEVALNGTIINTRDMQWTAYANATFNKNKVIKLNGEPITGGYNIIEEGSPYRQFYLPEYAGVDSETGTPLWYKGEEGTETTTNINEAGFRRFGSSDPFVLGGFGSTFKWKGFDASIGFNYRMGGQVYDYGAAFTGWGMSLRVPLKEMALNSWTPENKNAKYPQYIYGDPYKASSGDSSRWLYKSDFLRLNNVTIGYTLPEKWTKSIMIEKLRVYFSGDNLYTLTNKDFIGWTPDTYESGLISWQFPGVTSFVGGLQITF